MLPAVRDLLAAYGVHDVRITAAAGDERRMAREAAAAGIETIVALGGDGTWGNAARGILESGRDARLILVAAGTGNDFGHALALPTNDPQAMIDMAIRGGEARVDVGRVDGIHFLNVAGFGIETSVLESSQHVKLLRGPLLYLALALPELWRYSAIPARIRHDGLEEPRNAYLALIAANGPRFGGGFRISPTATVMDGLLDFVSVRDARPLRRGAILARVRAGIHIGQSEVEFRRIASVTIEFDDPPLIDIDGELHPAQSHTVRVECLPAALRVAVRQE